MPAVFRIVGGEAHRHVREAPNALGRNFIGMHNNPRIFGNFAQSFAGAVPDEAGLRGGKALRNPFNERLSVENGVVLGEHHHSRLGKGLQLERIINAAHCIDEGREP